jgi:hypothetical protein
MENSLKSVIEMIDRVLGYVRQVINGEIEGNERIGKYLLDTLSEASDSAGVDKGQLDALFNSHLQASIHRRDYTTTTPIPSLNESSPCHFSNNLGYPHGLLSGKSCTIPSGSLDKTSAGFVIVVDVREWAINLSMSQCANSLYIWINDHFLVMHDCPLYAYYIIHTGDILTSDIWIQ